MADDSLVSTLLTGLAGGSLVTGLLAVLFGRRVQAAEANHLDATVEVQLSEDARSWATELLGEVRRMQAEQENLRAELLKQRDAAGYLKSRVALLERVIHEAGLTLPS